jgi:hypothetical protein
MPRFILIDDATGYIFGDTADMPSGHLIDGAAVRDREMTPELAARWLDEAVIGAPGRVYVKHPRAPGGGGGYHVYRADIDGSDAVAVVTDGQDAETIRAVVESGEFVCFVETRDPA